MYKPFGLFTPHRISYRSLDPVDYTHPSHNFGRCTRALTQRCIRLDTESHIGCNAIADLFHRFTGVNQAILDKTFEPVDMRRRESESRCLKP